MSIPSVERVVNLHAARQMEVSRARKECIRIVGLEAPLGRATQP